MRQAVEESVKICKPGLPFREVGKKCEETARKYGFSVCKEFTGHGIGEHLHMPPAVFSFEDKS